MISAFHSDLIVGGRINRRTHVPFFRSPALVQRIICRNSKNTYQIEVEVDEGEDDEGVLKRFRNQVMNTNILYEVKRRRFFENTHDIMMRKQQEKGMKKRQAKRDPYILTLSDALENTEAEAHVFGDLFPTATEVTDVSVEEEPASSSELQLDGLPKDVHQRVMRLTQINNKMMQKRWSYRSIQTDPEAASASSERASTSERQSKGIPFQTSKMRRAAEKGKKSSPMRRSDSNLGSSASQIGETAKAPPAQMSDLRDKKSRARIQKPNEGEEDSERILGLLRQADRDLTTSDLQLLKEEDKKLAVKGRSLQGQSRAGMSKAQKDSLRHRIASAKKLRLEIARTLKTAMSRPEQLPTASDVAEAARMPAIPEPATARLTPEQSEEVAAAKAKLRELETTDRDDMNTNQRNRLRTKIVKAKAKIVALQAQFASLDKETASELKEALKPSQNGAGAHADHLTQNAIEGARVQLSSQFSNAAKRPASV